MFDEFRYHEPQSIDTVMGCIMGGVCGLSVAVLHPIVLPLGGIFYGVHKYRLHRFHAKKKGGVMPPPASHQNQSFFDVGNKTSPAKMPLSANTLHQYEMMVARVKKEGILDFDDPDTILKWLEDKSASGQKAYLSALKWYAKENDKDYPDELQEQLNALYKAQNKRDEEQKLSTKQETQYVPWKDILAVQTMLAEKKEKTGPEWRHYVLSSLYTLHPPVRLDYHAMKVVTRHDKKHTGNTLVWNSSSPRFIFREYKTDKTYGIVEIPLMGALHRVLKEWFAYLGGVPEYVLGDHAITPATLSEAITTMFAKYTGKHVGVSLLRHAYITDVFPTLKSIKQKNEIARRMMHDRVRQEMYVVQDE